MKTSGNDVRWRNDVSWRMSSAARKCIQENYMKCQVCDYVLCIASNGE